MKFQLLLVTAGTCAYFGTGTSCKLADCSEVLNPSAENCLLYNSRCAFDGLACVTYGSCTSYTARTNGGGKVANC